MLKVGICDDDKTISTQIETLIMEYSEKSGKQIIVNTFLDGSELINYIKGNYKFDLIFLDIEMKNMNGLKVGKFIRNELDDHITEIAYVSWYSNYAMDLFEVQPIDFIEKPLVAKEIYKCIMLTEKLFVKENNVFCFVSQNKIYRIKYKDIMYFESCKKIMKIVTVDGTYEFYSNFNELKSKLNEDFVMSHRSYLVNLRLIRRVDTTSLTFFNNEVISVSRSKLENVKNVYWICMMIIDFLQFVAKKVPFVENVFTYYFLVVIISLTVF